MLHRTSLFVFAQRRRSYNCTSVRKICAKCQIQCCREQHERCKVFTHHLSSRRMCLDTLMNVKQRQFHRGQRQIRPFVLSTLPSPKVALWREKLVFFLDLLLAEELGTGRVGLGQAGRVRVGAQVGVRVLTEFCPFATGQFVSLSLPVLLSPTSLQQCCKVASLFVVKLELWPILFVRAWQRCFFLSPFPPPFAHEASGRPQCCKVAIFLPLSSSTFMILTFRG